ncbi:MAG: lipopolysaccharide biosynthesis protein [Planctomycetes bacterium]|nr:lipopolysaccharide biosynthesis protein [Planctomycetota bacterium]
MNAFIEQIKEKAKSRFLRDAAHLQIGATIQLIAGVGASVVIVRSFGVIGFGAYSEGLNLYALIYFLGNVGMFQMTVARVSEAVGRKDPKGAARALGVFFRVYSTIAIILMCAGFFGGPLLAKLLKHPVETGIWASILCISGPLMAPFYMVQTALQGTRRMRLLARMENYKEILRAYVTVVGALTFGGPLGAILGEVATSLIAVGLAYFIYRQAHDEPGIELPALREIWRLSKNLTWQEFTDEVRSGMTISVQKNFAALLPQIVPRALLGYFASEKEVGFLSLALNLMAKPMQGLTGISRTLMPTLGALRGAGEHEQLRKLIIKVMLLSGIMMTAGTGAAAIALHWLIPIVYGPQNLPVLDLLPWLWVSMSIAGFAVGAEAFFIIVNKIWVAIRISVSALILTSGPGIYCIYRWHAPGAAMFVMLMYLSAAANVAYIFYYFSQNRKPAVAPGAA